jgi:hypothetical protein
MKYKQNIQELWDSDKRPNLWIMSIEVEEAKAKGIWNIFNKVKAGNFPNLENNMPIQLQEACRTPKWQDHNRTSPHHIIVKIWSIEKKERILKSARENYL